VITILTPLSSLRGVKLIRPRSSASVAVRETSILFVEGLLSSKLILEISSLLEEENSTKYFFLVSKTPRDSLKPKTELSFRDEFGEAFGILLFEELFGELSVGENLIQELRNIKIPKIRL